MQRSAATGPLFLPHRCRRARFLKWLRRTHAWFALWGGVAGLAFGATGILLNHRAVMKIPAVESTPSSMQLPLQGFRPVSPEALADWVAAQLVPQLTFEGAPRTLREPPRPVDWDGRRIVQPERWEATFSNPRASVTAEYWAGNNHVTLRRRDGNVFYLLTRLHQAQGVHPGWILLADSIAGSLIVLAITGFLLWSRLHGPRLLALGLMGGSLSGLAAFALMSV